MRWHEMVYAHLVHAALVSCMLGLVATACLLLTRQPARRIRIVQATLAALVIVPFVALVPGFPRWGVLTRFTSVGRPIAAAPGSPPETARPIVDNAPRTIAAQAPPRAAEHRGVPTQTSASTVDRPSRATSERAQAVTPARSSNAVRHSPSLPAQYSIPLRDDYRFWIVCGYLFGVLLMIAWSCVGLLAARRLVRTACPCDDSVSRLLLRDGGDGERSRGARRIVANRSAVCASMAAANDRVAGVTLSVERSAAAPLGDRARMVAHRARPPGDLARQRAGASVVFLSTARLVAARPFAAVPGFRRRCSRRRHWRIGRRLRRVSHAIVARLEASSTGGRLGHRRSHIRIAQESRHAREQCATVGSQESATLEPRDAADRAGGGGWRRVSRRAAGKRDRQNASDRGQSDKRAAASGSIERARQTAG